MILKKSKFVFFFMAACLTLSACNFPGFQGTIPTNEAQSVLQTSMANAMLGMTQTASVGKPTTAAIKTVSTPVPVTIPTTIATQKPLQNNTGTDDATLAAETIPDDTKYLPGATFTKTWRLMNSGSSTWSNDYKLVFASGDQMGANTEYRIPVPVEPGKIIDMSVQMKAPDTAGNYKGYWKIKNPDGTIFGPGGTGSFWVKIIVNAPTATLTTVPTGIPTSTSVPPTATVEPTQG
jgi:hypothetical protein